MRCVRISTLRSTCKSLAQTRPLTPASQLPFSVSSISSSRTSSDPLRRNAYCTSTTTIAPCLPSKRPPATKTRLSSSARSTSTWSSTAPKVTPAPNTAGHPSSPSPAGPPTPLPESTHSAPAASSDMNGAPPPASRPKRKSSYKVGEDRPSKLQRSANGSSAAPPAAAGASGPAAEHSDDPMLDDGDQGSDDGWVSDIDDDGYGHDDSMAVGDVGEYGAESNGNISDPNSSRFGSPKLQRRSSKKQVSASLASGPPPVLLATGNAETAEWQETIQRVVRNVVSIRFCMTCSFDTDPALTSEATGFVVDAKRGYVLRCTLFATDVEDQANVYSPSAGTFSQTVTLSAPVLSGATVSSTTMRRSMPTPYTVTPSTTLASSSSTQQKSSTCPSRHCHCAPTWLKVSFSRTLSEFRAKHLGGS